MRFVVTNSSLRSSRRKETPSFSPNDWSLLTSAATNNQHRRSRGDETPVSLPATASNGFTLIELILVLALLVVATSLIAPSLSHFFKGRALDSEARQLLALVHAGQSRAVSEGFPMLLWFDSPGHAYGLEEETPSGAGKAAGTDPHAEEFSFEDQVSIEPVNASPMPVNGRTLPAIRFLPDGSVDESSASTVRISAQPGGTLWLVQATNHLKYEIRAIDKPE